MIILSGAEVRDALKKELIKDVANLSKKPKLVIIQIGDKSESNIYIKQKKKFGEDIGIDVILKKYVENVKEDEIVEDIRGYNNDNDVGGIIVQLPIPKVLNKSQILNTIASRKDVDGLSVSQMGLLYSGDKNAIVPATARGIFSLLDFYKIDIESKKVVVLGRSNLVGKPVAQLCSRRNATVTICHSYTKHLEEITKRADILIVACGVKGLINSNFVSLGQVVIDVGIHRTEKGIVGDVDFESVKGVVSSITMVPGGVGPLTVVSLFQNLMEAQKR